MRADDASATINGAQPTSPVLATTARPIVRPQHQPLRVSARFTIFPMKIGMRFATTSRHMPRSDLV